MLTPPILSSARGASKSTLFTVDSKIPSEKLGMGSKVQPKKRLVEQVMLPFCCFQNRFQTENRSACFFLPLASLLELLSRKHSKVLEQATQSTSPALGGDGAGQVPDYVSR